MQITISNAEITGQGGDIHNATITGEAQLASPVPPTEANDPWYGIDVDEGYVRPSHPIALPPTSEDPNTFYVLCYCANPPPPHWEWIAFSPGDPPARPQPEPPPTEPPTSPGGIKPPPPDGGWGYFPGYGWVYYPGPGGASPKSRKK